MVGQKDYRFGHNVCAAKGCGNKSYLNRDSFFRFPKDPKRARIWAITCNREDLLDKLNQLHASYRICQIHFEEKFYGPSKKKLTRTAVPTIFPSLVQSNKAIADSRSKEYHSETVSISPGELAVAVDSVQVKKEQNESVEIKCEDMLDVCEETASIEIIPSCLWAENNVPQINDLEERKESIHYEVNIKEEEESPDATILFQNSVNCEADMREPNLVTSQTQAVISPSTPIISDSTLGFIESAIKIFVERESNCECTQEDIALKRLELVDLCIKHLTNYRRFVIQLIIKSHRKSGLKNEVTQMDKSQAIADSRSKEYPSETVSISSGELAVAVDSVQVKKEQNDSAEIKCEDILDVYQEIAPIEIIPSCLWVEKNVPQINDLEERKESIHYEVNIKEEEESPDATILFQNSVSREADIREPNIVTNQTQAVNSPSTATICDSTLGFIESAIKIFVERESNSECTQEDIALKRLELVDLCIKHLTNYRRSLTQSIIKSRRKSGLKNEVTQMDKSQGIESVNEESFVARSIQTGSVNEDDRQAAKRQKVEVTTCNQQIDLPLNNEIKTEKTHDLFETETILNFPRTQERIMAISRVGKELLLATETGNIIFMSLTDESICHCLDVTQCPITSLAFVNGINDSIYMYVGSLEKVLRVYDFRSRKMLRVNHIDDQISCMDAMWDYVFMGCKNGALIRYLCEKEKIEFEEKNSTTEILVLKAAYEGPRRVLIVGHRQTPIYVRDAMTGLYLRNFSNQAIAPTLYSLVLDENSLFCGSVKDDILIFSLHEGYLIGKITFPDSKGIGCMKIYKNLLFAGGSNGSIYVYNLHQKDLVTILKGPGGSISCMEVLSNQVVVGTLTPYFASITLPKDIFLE